MSLINSKAELKVRWTNYGLFPAPGDDNTNTNPSNIIFTIKDKKLYVHVVTLSGGDNEKLPKSVSKGFERSVYPDEYKTKSENKNTKNEYRYFLESISFKVNRLFVLVHSNKDDNSKRFKTRRYHLPKGTIKNCNIIIKG